MTYLYLGITFLISGLITNMIWYGMQYFILKIAYSRATQKASDSINSYLSELLSSMENDFEKPETKKDSKLH